MVDIDRLAESIVESVREYTEEIEDAIPSVLDEVAQDVLVDIKARSPKDQGDYAKSWAVKKTTRNGRHQRLIFNRKHYQLTHLLEFGHANRGGGRTRAMPHIASVAQDHAGEFEKKLVRIGRGGK